MQNVLATRQGKGGLNAPRLYILFARNAETAVIFRRGPSAWVQIIRWNTADDSFEPGQWFHGRIYERRSDLSPDGAFLLYFVRKINGRTLADSEYTYAWTAISLPPYLTALALWPKGDCWHGGGFFQTDSQIELNHKPDRAVPHPSHLPFGLKVRLRNHVHGEDDPIYSERLGRDGWQLKTDWEFEGWTTTQPQIRVKRGHLGKTSLRMMRSFLDLKYSEEFALLHKGKPEAELIDGASWVDFDQFGRIVIARAGKICIASFDETGKVEEQLLFDTNGSKPTPLPAPEWATRW